MPPPNINHTKSHCDNFSQHPQLLFTLHSPRCLSAQTPTSPKTLQPNTAQSAQNLNVIKILPKVAHDIPEVRPVGGGGGGGRGRCRARGSGTKALESFIMTPWKVLCTLSEGTLYRSRLNAFKFRYRSGVTLIANPPVPSE